MVVIMIVIMVMSCSRRMNMPFITCRMAVCPVGRVVMVVNIPMVVVVIVVVIMLVRVVVIMIVLI